METSSVEGAFSLMAADGSTVPGTVSWNGDNTELTYTLTQNLDYQATYRVQISTAALSSASPGIAIAEAVDQSFATMVKNDFNGDGVADLAIGSYNLNFPDCDECGGVYVFSGAGINNETTVNDAWAKIYGAHESDYCGEFVAMAGDVNADGYTDIIVSSTYEDRDAAADDDDGYVHIFSGAAIAEGAVLATSDALASIRGMAEAHYFGQVLSSAGDVNNDGYGDIIIAQGSARNPAGDNLGAVFVFYGNVLNGVLEATAANAIIYGLETGASFAVSASGLGDVNNDNFDDIVVGAYFTDFVDGAGVHDNRAGAAYIYSGVELNGTITGDNFRAVIYGAQAHDMSGFSVAGVGDVNKDGVSDIVVGAFKADHISGLADIGAAYVYSGNITGSLWAGEGAMLATLWGPHPDSQFGYAVNKIGDVDNDGYNDVAVSAPLTIAPGSGDLEAGAVFVYSGQTLTGVGIPATAAIYGPNAGDKLGWYGFAGDIDINEDGYADLLIGNYGRNDAYIFNGDVLSGIVTGANALVVINNPDGGGFGTAVSKSSY
jgi:hypothetical protein